MNIQPLGDRIVVTREAAETVSVGGIVLAGAAADKPSKGIVVAVGTGKVFTNGTTREMHVKTGDSVLFNKLSGVTVKLEDIDYLFLTEDDIMAVLVNESPN